MLRAKKGERMRLKCLFPLRFGAAGAPNEVLLLRLADAQLLDHGIHRGVALRRRSPGWGPGRSTGRGAGTAPDGPTLR